MDILSWTFLPDGRRYQQTDSNIKVKEKAPQYWKQGAKQWEGD